jgi:hypothetical protein
VFYILAFRPLIGLRKSRQAWVAVYQDVRHYANQDPCLNVQAKNPYMIVKEIVLTPQELAKNQVRKRSAISGAEGRSVAVAVQQ